MLEAFYIAAVVGLAGLFLWPWLYRHFLIKRPRTALVVRYSILLSWTYGLSMIISSQIWGLLRKYVLIEHPAYIWGSLLGVLVGCGTALVAAYLLLSPRHAKMIEQEMTATPEPSAPDEAHWLYGLSFGQKVVAVIASLCRAVIDLGVLALIGVALLVILAFAWLALDGLNRIETPQAILIGAIIIAFALAGSRRA